MTCEDPETPRNAFAHAEGWRNHPIGQRQGGEQKSPTVLLLGALERSAGTRRSLMLHASVEADESETALLIAGADTCGQDGVLLIPLT